MEANNFNQMMMGMNPMNNMNQMEMNMNQINNMNLVMMDMMNPFGIDVNPMNNMMMFPNNPLMNDLNNEENFQIDNLNCKNIRLYYGDEFISNFTISKDENYNFLSEKLKSILFSFGKKTYCGPHKVKLLKENILMRH